MQTGLSLEKISLLYFNLMLLKDLIVSKDPSNNISKRLADECNEQTLVANIFARMSLRMKRASKFILISKL
jgi:hypothetical protein